MGKLHKKMVALGDMTQYSYDDIVEKCGEPKEKHACTFSDIGDGTRATWSDGIFSITFNFNSEGHYCGIYDHKNWSPYIWLSVITAVILAAAFIYGAHMRKVNAQSAAAAAADADALSATLLDAESDWRTDATAGMSLIDLDFDGTPELLAVDTEFVDMDGSKFFGDTDVRVFRVTDAGVSAAGGFTVPEYCFMAELTRYDTAWCFDDGGVMRPVTFSGGQFAAGDGSAVSAEGSETVSLMPNESWVRADGAAADADTVSADISAAAQAWQNN